MTYTTNLGLRKPEPNDYYNVEDFNANMDAIDAAAARHVIASRERDPSLPTYGIGNQEAVLLTGPYTGTAEISLQVEEREYDAENMSAKPATSPNGTIIIKKVEE